MLEQIKHILISAYETQLSNLSNAEKKIKEAQKPLFAKKYEILNYKERHKFLSKIPFVSRKAKKEFNVIEKQLSSMLEETLQIVSQRSQGERKIEDIERAKNLTELGYDFASAKDFLESKGWEPFLERGDKIPTNPWERPLGSKELSDKVMLVRKTEIRPEKSLILTPKNGGALTDAKKSTFTILGDNLTLQVPLERETIHFCQNCEVASHAEGKFDGTKYAVIIPMDDVPKESIKSAAVGDTFVKGNVSLTKDSYILCPANEVRMMRKLNPETNVIGYSGANVDGFAEILLSNLDINIKSPGTPPNHAHSQEMMEEIRGTHSNFLLQTMKHFEKKGQLEELPNDKSFCNILKNCCYHEGFIPIEGTETTILQRKLGEIGVKVDLPSTLNDKTKEQITDIAKKIVAAFGERDKNIELSPIQINKAPTPIGGLI